MDENPFQAPRGAEVGLAHRWLRLAALVVVVIVGSLAILTGAGLLGVQFYLYWRSAKF